MGGGGGGRDEPPPGSSANGGEFLLSLLRRPHHPQPQLQHPHPHPQPQPLNLTLDPAVAAVGPTIAFPGPPPNGHDFSSPPPWPPHHGHHHHHHHAAAVSPPSLYPHGFFGLAPPGGSQSPANHHNQGLPLDDFRRLGLGGFDERGVAPHNLAQQLKQLQLQQQQQQQRAQQLQRHQQEQSLQFGSIPPKIIPSEVVSIKNSVFDSAREPNIGSGSRSSDRFEKNRQFNLRGNSSANVNAPRRGNSELGERERRAVGRGKQNHVGNDRHMPPGFPANPSGRGNSGLGNRRTDFERNVDGEKNNRSEWNRRNVSSSDGDVIARRFQFDDHRMPSRNSGGTQLSEQLDRPGPPTGSNLRSVSASNVEESVALRSAAAENDGKGEGEGEGVAMRRAGKVGADELDDLLEDEVDEKNEKKQHRSHREKDFRSDSRGQRLLTQRMRIFKSSMECRWDIDRLNAPFLAIYDFLIPPEEEKAKQKQLLTLLEKLVSKEWPEAKLYLYGSCASSFGVCKSDIDVCLAIQDADIDKSEVILKLADILESDNLEDVQALTRARVPIVKLKDPATGISCDICINNVLAVVNTKLLRDYAQIDVRLRQLAFIVKHWAKSRGVNETYQGTLSSYAYVLMCIHFLQLRRPAILPCLQEMEATYAVTVDNIECAFFDKVEELCDFGSHNRETIAQLVWAFFHYWAYRHDYTNTVISVRTGSLLSKRTKDWTRRIGNDRHLICIEDPFDVSHDLGRVVDKFSIKVLREEFERAAEIMQYDPNPCVTLFEPYIAS
ncbi:UTP:RNA uridylyltransferase 1 [Syzygium oleosum]|uniref:UTP:RNA uridylyltransferase 1 n=1 Tax=Syzygium oleosum TaxID=219896 RepID=UPI0024BB7D14|nr:UTP:RNA uridylyltransferase 1 [Syzygium oleosum]